VVQRGLLRTPILVGAAVLLLVVGVAGGKWISSLRGNEGAARSARFFHLVLPDSAPLVAGRNRYDMDLRSLDISRDGQRVVYVTGQEGRTSLVLLTLDDGTATPLAGTEGATLPAFSPDGRAVAFVAGQELRRISLADGLVARVAEGAQFPLDLLWQDDDRIYLEDEICLFAVKSAGGELTQVGKHCGGYIGSLSAIGDRTDWLLVDYWAGAITLVSTATGEERSLGTAGTADSELVGSFPRFVAPNLLVFLRDSTLYAASFDPEALRLTGEPLAVLTGIRRESTGSAHLAIAHDGTMVWASGGDGTAGRFVWVGQDGRVQDTLFLPPSEVLSYALSHDGRRLAIQHALPRGRQSMVIADLQRRMLDSVAYGGYIGPENWIRSDRALTIVSNRWRGVLEVGGGDLRIDSTGGGFQDEAPATRLQCHAGNLSTRLWPAGSRADSVVLQRAPGAWCRFSPDGRWLTWKGLNPGGIFLSPADSLGARDRLQVGPDGGDEPRWSRDGRDIIYRKASQWYAVRVPDRRGADAGEPRLLFQGHYLQAVESWDLGPDGRFLLLQGLPPVRLTTLRVMTGLPSLLEAKLKEGRH
jgi:hypothetical protein